MNRILRTLVVVLLVALACGQAAGGVAVAPGGHESLIGSVGPSVANAQDERGPSDREADRLLPEVRSGFDGLGKAGRWLPVQVVVASDGPTLSGEARLVTRLSGGGPRVAYSQDVEVTQRGRKLLQFAAPAPASAGELRVELVSGGQELAARGVPVRLLNPTDFLVGVLSDDGVPPAGLASVRRGGGAIGVARLTPADLPSDPVVLQALDAIVVRNAAGDRLTGAQRSALRAWIELGGQLVVSGGPGWRRSVEGLDDLLPVAGLWSREVKRLRAFGLYAGAEPPEDSAIVTLGSPIEGARVMLTQDGIPLIVERWLGQGRVTFLGVDPALAPFRSWANSESLWQRILVGGRPVLPVLDDPGTGPADTPLRGVLANLLDVGLPSAGWLAGFVLLYVAAVGPGQYVLLRRLDRREWAWLGFPLLALGFAGTIYLVGTWSRGPEVRVVAVSIVRSVPDAATAPVDTYVGLVAPARRAYDLTFVDSPSIRTLPGRGGVAGEEAVIRLGPPTRLPELRLEGRTLQGFQTRTSGPAPTPVKAELRATTGGIEGLVRNVGPDRIEDAILLASGEALALGDVPPGESRPVSLALPTTRTGGPWRPTQLPWVTTGGPSLAEQRRQLLSAILQPGRGADGEAYGGVVLMGWLGATAPRLTVDGVATPGTATRLLEQALPVEYGEETVLIPPGLLGRSILDGAALGRGPAPSFVARGPIVFQYDLPPTLSLARIDRLSVHAALYGPNAVVAVPAVAGSPQPSPSASTGTAAAGRVSLYRWADRTWVDVAIASSGVGDVPFGAAFVDAGAIRLRLEPIGPETIVQQLDLSLEGVRQ